jgi:hypothetical protein
MGRVRFCLLFVLAAILGGLAVSGPAAASSCASRLLADWRDGRIDGTYAVPCYRETLANLPEDVRVYSTASGDITRALQARLEKVSARAGASTGDGGGHADSPLVVLAICGAVLLAAGSVAAVVR